MTAKAARAITNENLKNNKVIVDAYANTMKWIEWAARQGKCYIDFDTAVQTQSQGVKLCIKYMLLADGYKIIEKNDLGGLWDCHDCIAW